MTFRKETKHGLILYSQAFMKNFNDPFDGFEMKFDHGFGFSYSALMDFEFIGSEEKGIGSRGRRRRKERERD